MSDTLYAFSAPVIGLLSLGFFLGLKHAVEADHLAAVSTIVSERRSLFSSILVGGVWGLGHTISLVTVGIVVLLLNIRISPAVETALETCVGFMLALLGLNVLRRLLSGGHLRFHQHDHGPHSHVHPHVDGGPKVAVDQDRAVTFNSRPLVVGVVHGLAGSAALMLLIIPTIGSPVVGLVYILIFGIGSITGMMLMSLLIGLPFHLAITKFTRLDPVMQGTTGIIGVGLGLWIVFDRLVL